MTFPSVVVEFAPGAGPFDLISYLNVTGSAGVGCSVTDSAATSPTEAMEVIAHIAPVSWSTGADQAIVAKWTTSGNQKSFAYGINTTGGMFAQLSSNGSTTLRYDSSVNLGYDANQERWLRWTFNNNVASGTFYIVDFYESPDGVSWRQVGQGWEDDPPFDIFDSTSPTVIGNTSDLDKDFAGRVYEVRLAQGGINDFDQAATTYANPVFRNVASGASSFTDDEGILWAVGAGGSIVGLTQWVDISSYVLGAAWSDGKSEEHEAFPPGDATVTLKNDDRRFDPDNTAGPYYGSLEPRTPFRIRSTVDSGSTYAGHFYGFVEGGFEQTYGHPELATCRVQLTDLLGVISGYTLPSVLDREILRDEPFAYWPLDDEAGSSSARDASGNGHDGAYRNDAALTSVDEGIAFNAAARSFNGINQAVDFPNSARLDLSTLQLSTFAMYRTSATATSGEYDTIYMAGGDPHQLDVLRFTVDDTTALSFTFIQDGGGSTVQTSETGFNDGANHCVQWNTYATRDVDDSALLLREVAWVDGATYATTGTTQGSNQQSAVVIGGHPNPNNPRDYFEGALSHIALFQTRLPYSRMQAQQAAASAPMSGSRSDEQIAWVLDYIGVPSSLRDLDQGRALMGPADTKGKDALEFIRQVVETEGGGFYVDHTTGKLRFVERYTHWTATRSTTSQATFSDDASSTTAVRVEPGSLVVKPNGIDSVINQVSVTWVGGTERAEDATSIRRWGPRGREVNAQAGTPAQALGLAQWILALSPEPHTAVVGLGLNPGAAQSAFPVARDLRINDLITFRSQPQSTGSVTTRSLLVLGSSHQVEQGVSWLVDYRVSSSPAERGIDLFTLDSSLLDSADILGY